MDKLVLANDVFFDEVIHLLDKGRRVTIPVKGFSMLPFIRGGKDTVVLEKATEIAPDDIVLFRYSGRWVMHRVLFIEDGLVTIQGDGVWSGREVVGPKQIYGRAVEILRRGKRRVNPYSAWQLWKVHRWQGLGRLRRYILFIYRHLPWNKKWLYDNGN